MKVTVRFYRVQASGSTSNVEVNSVPITIVQGLNSFAHGLTGKPKFLAFWQDDVFLTPDFQNTVRTDTEIQFSSPADFGDCVMEVAR